MTERCPELEAALLDRAGDPRRRAEHQNGCAVCQRGLDAASEVKAAVLATDTLLDDMTRARVQTRLAAELDGEELRPQRGGRRWLVPVVGAALVAAAAAALLWVARGGRPERGGAAPPMASPAPSPSLVPEVKASALIPYFVAGEGGGPLAELLGRPQTAVAVPPGVRVRLAVGRRVRLTLIGPARLAIEAAQAGRIRLALTTGTLLGDYDHTAGGALEIRSPGALTTIVGTLFAVEAQGGQSRVSVARGRVRVAARGRTAEVAERRALDADGAAAEIAPTLARELAEHEESMAPPEGAWGSIALSGSSDAAGVDIRLGDQRLGAAPLWALVPVGDATVEVRAAGRAPVSLRTEVKREQSSTLAYALADVRAPAPPKPAPSVPAALAEASYARAEAAMRRGDLATARSGLRDLIERHPKDSLAQTARYDLARLAFRAGDVAEATRQLDALLADRPQGTLGEMADYLRCRVYLRADRAGDASRCLSDFRARHPASPHDAEALALLADLARDQCDHAVPLLVEYRERYPQGAFAAEAARRETQCRR